MQLGHGALLTNHPCPEPEGVNASP